MKRLLLATALSLPVAFGAASGAKAAFTFTDGDFITLTQTSNITFTFLGSVAGNINMMFGGASEGDGGEQVFDASTATPGDTYTVLGVGPGVYKLYLTSTGGAGNFAWSSDPDENVVNGGSTQLAFTDNFADFSAGAENLPGPAVTFALYYGWEDMPFATSDQDFNDLVFGFVVTPVPEPASLALLGMGLLGLGFAARRRRG